MTQRRARVKKVVAIREKELDGRVQKLGEARAQAARVEEERQRAADALARASAERTALAQGSISAADWRDANEWLASRERSHVAAGDALKRAEEHVERTQHAVLTARTALKGVEMLDQKLHKEEQKDADKATRKLEDELARARATANAQANDKRRS
jgi:flagellar export protein FliJ